MIIFRRLNHDDYNEIVEISKDIWDGADYLPSVFHEWVDSPGSFIGAIFEYCKGSLRRKKN